MRNIRTISACLISLGLLASALPVQATEALAMRISQPAPQCYTDWTEAADVIKREKLASVRDLHALAKKRHIGDVVRVTLCSDQGKFVYKIMLREPSGSVSSRIVSATSPFDH